MKNKIKVSVIIYVKNTSLYIAQCIRSVMAQTLRELEILVIDGGSTDGTLEIIEALKREDDRIRLFHGPSSVGAQFNLGLQEARGQYIGICEADDYILSDMYEKQYQIAEKNHLDVIRAGYYQFCTVNHMEYRFQKNACTQDALMEKELVSNDWPVFLEQGINGFWSGLYRKSFLLDNHIQMNETKGAAHQDITFSFLTQMYAERFWFMKDSFYCYRIDNSGASVNSIRDTALHMAEYEMLEEKLKIAEQWEKYKNIFFSWELLSYQWLLKQLSGSLQKNSVKDIYRHLKLQYEENGYDVNQLLKNARKSARVLISGENDFVCNMLSGTEYNENLLSYMETFFESETKIVLFGAGHLGSVVMQFLELCGKEVFLTDNSSYLQQNGIMGKMVYRPDEVTIDLPNETYLIASAGYAEEMKQQLLGYGIREEKILICNDEEFFLRQIYVKRGNLSYVKE